MSEGEYRKLRAQARLPAVSAHDRPYDVQPTAIGGIDRQQQGFIASRRGERHLPQLGASQKGIQSDSTTAEVSATARR